VAWTSVELAAGPARSDPTPLPSSRAWAAGALLLGGMLVLFVGSFTRKA
jgi:hypothetical protein